MPIFGNSNYNKMFTGSFFVWQYAYIEEHPIWGFVR